jgi:hypothetical protein
MPLAGALVLGGSSLLGGLFSGNAAEEGAKQQAAAMREAAELQQQRYEQNVGFEQPYMQAGGNALQLYSNFLGLNGTGAQTTAMNGFQNSPYFQQMVNNAGDLTKAQYSARGVNGGNMLNALFNQNAQLWNGDFQNYLGQLAGQANTGLSATNALAGVGTQSAATEGNLIAGAGAAQGAGTLGFGNAVGNAIGNAGVFAMLGANGFNNTASGSYNPSWPATIMGPATA